MTEDENNGGSDPPDYIDITISPDTEYHLSIHIGDLPDGLQRLISTLGHMTADFIDELSLPEKKEK